MSDHPLRKTRIDSVFIVLVCLLATAWYLLNIYRGTPQVDEGIYIYKAKEVMSGVRLYRDAAWTQPPLFPYILGPFLKITGYGLVEARLANFIFVVIAALLALTLIRRELPGWDGAVLWAAVFLTPLVSYYLILFKHHALEAALTLFSLFLLRRENLRPAARLSLAMISMAVLACIRMPYIATFPLLFIYFLLFHRKEPRAVVLSAIAGAAVLAVVYLLFLRGCFPQARFGTWNLTAGLFPPPPGGKAGYLLSRAQYLESVIRGYFPVLGLMCSLALACLLRKGPRRCARFLIREHWLLLVFVLPFSWISPGLFTNNPQNNWVVNAVIVWGVGAAAVVRKLRESNTGVGSPRAIAATAIGFFAVGAALNYPFGFNREPALASLYTSYRLTKMIVPDAQPIFSCQVFEGAVAPLLPDSQLSVFGYSDRMKSSDPAARKNHILTEDRLVRALESRTPGAVLVTEYYCPDFSREPLRSALRNNYKRIRTLRNYGQGQGVMRYFIPQKKR